MQAVMKTTAAAIFLMGAASIVRAQVAAPDSGAVPVEAVDAYVRGVLEKRHVPGASIAVVKDGRVVLAKGYGQANVELNAPATEETVYQLASVTKPFTASAVMLLAKDGKIGLDDKIGDRLPDLPDAWKAVTVRQLLSHTSGIKSYTSARDFDKMMRKDFAPREILDLVAKEPLEFPPGERWSYSNTGYFLLGLLIEEASGKPYADFMAERVFGPLGMTRTRVNDLRAVVPGRAQGYEWDGKGLRNGEYVSPTQPFSAGALLSTVVDLAKWDAALSNASLLDEPTLRGMWTRTRLGKGGEADYGLGWQVSEAEGRPMIAHGGGIPGFSTQVCRFPGEKLSVIVLTNLEGGHAGEMARGIAGVIVPALAPKPMEPIADADEAATARLRNLLASCVKGEPDPEQFAEEAGKVLVPRIRETKGQLASLGELKDFRLLERKETGGTLRLRYRATFENQALRATFVLDGAGKVQGLMIQPDQ